LLGSLRVPYSEFFRDPLTFGLLEGTVLPRLVERAEAAAHRELRVWSAGCAAGQEAWSIAMLLDELSSLHGGTVDYRVIATDWSEPDLALAREASYSDEALANVRLRHLSSCFVRNGERRVVADRLRTRVEFSWHDLLDGATTCPPASIYGEFDLVLCCNVLLYYRPDAQRSILHKLWRSLAEGGHLVTGDAERNLVASAGSFGAPYPPAAVFRAVPWGGEP
jgi:chemotaxis methyl-accepting protein methylase